MKKNRPEEKILELKKGIVSITTQLKFEGKEEVFKLYKTSNGIYGIRIESKGSGVEIDYPFYRLGLALEIFTNEVNKEEKQINWYDNNKHIIDRLKKECRKYNA